MAESLNSPLISAVPLEPSGPKVAKNTNSDGNFGQRDDFSRVLDKQQSRSQETEKPAESASQTRNSGKAADEASGKALPQDGNQAAEAANNDDVSGGKPSDAAATPGSDGGGDTSEAVAQDAPPATTDESGAVSAEDALVAGDLLSQGALTTSLAIDTSDKITAAAAVGSALPKEAAAAASLSGSAQAPGSLQTPGEAAPRSLTGSVTVDARNLAAANPDGVKAGALPAVATRAGGTVSAGAVQADLDGLDLGVGAGAKVPGTVEGAQKLGTSGNEGQRASVSQLDASALKATTADWIRANMDSQSVSQRLGDLQLDGASELARATVAAPRGEGAAATLVASSPVAGLAPATAAASPATAAAPPGIPEFSLTRGPDDAEFPGELTARMKTLVRDGVREARLQLHPAELGRLQVTITTEGDQAKVAFTAETSAARDAIEQSLPKLREMLEQSGLQLAHTDVGEQGFQGETEQGDAKTLAESDGATELDEADTPVVFASAGASARIDTYI